LKKCSDKRKKRGKGEITYDPDVFGDSDCDDCVGCGWVAHLDGKEHRCSLCKGTGADETYKLFRSSQLKKIPGRRRLTASYLSDLAGLTRRLADVKLANTKAKDVNIMSPAELVIHQRRLADAMFLAAKDVDSMSISELDTHRRRLKYGRRVPPTLAELTEEIEERQRDN